MNTDQQPEPDHVPSMSHGSSFFKQAKPVGAEGRTVSPPPQEVALPQTVSEEAQKKLKKRKKCNKFAWIVCVEFLVLTVAVAGMNWWILKRNRAAGLPRYQLVYASSVAGVSEFQANVDWKENPRSQNSAPIIVKLDGKPLPCLLNLPPTAGKIQTLELEFEIPWNCAPGWHKGELQLGPVSARAEGALRSRNYPLYDLNIEVLGFMQQWARTRNFCIILLLGYGVVYCLYCLIYAIPKGRLLVRLSEEREPRSLDLHRRRMSWLFPWLRPDLPLNWISKQMGGIELLDAYRGNVSFDRVMEPVLELEDSDAKVRYSYYNHKRCPRPDEGVLCGSFRLLLKGNAVVFWDNERRVSATMTYIPPD